MQTSAEDWASITEGAFRLLNNTWGKPANAAGGEQRIFGPLPMGWSWDWQRKVRKDDQHEPIGFPSIVVGNRVWDDSGTSTASQLPIEFGSIQSLEVGYTYSLQATGHYNVALNVWFADAEQKRLVEILVMLERSDGVHPHSDSRLGNYLGDAHEGTRDTPNLLWQIYSFVSDPAGVRSNTLDLLGYCHWLAANDRSLAGLKLCCIEFGTEIWEGAGRIEVPQFQLLINGEKLSAHAT